MLGTILLIVIILLVIGALPTWGYSGGWGYFPSGGLGLVLIIVIVLLQINALNTLFFRLVLAIYDLFGTSRDLYGFGRLFFEFWHKSPL